MEITKTKKNDSAKRLLSIIGKGNQIQDAHEIEINVSKKAHDGNPSDGKTLICRSKGCGVLVEKGAPYIEHLEAFHPLYRPTEPTLNNYGCTRCLQCDNSIKILGHVCRKFKSQKLKIYHKLT